MSNIVRALSLKYQSEIESARANIEVYMNNPAGIGEHPDIVQAVDSELVKLSTAEDKLASLESNYPQHTPEYLAEKYAQANLFEKLVLLSKFKTPLFHSFLN